MSTPRIDVVSIFPEYLAPLDLSLVGKARTSGLVDLRVHDLRDVTTDRHRTVDDAPFGGGAGMVMRPDVWLRAIEATAQHRPDPSAEPTTDPREVLVLVPTPSGVPLTQATLADLATTLASPDVRAVITCGRYEGIDARLVERLADTPGVRAVHELSLGDYVLNGGEVAALAMIEGVVRLLPGVLGNPESVVEESFSQPLLEYPVYTRPADWDGFEVPAVLTSGHHGAVQRWRRDVALTRTARRRPALLRELAVADLDVRDRAVLAEAGVVVGRDGRLLGPVRVRPAAPDDAARLADVAAITFPLACPDSTTLGEVRAHVAEHLSVASFEAHLADPEHLVLVLEDHDGELLGYALVLVGAAQGDGAPVGVDGQDCLAELSKLYLLPRARGTGLAGTLMDAALAAARGRGVAAVWLGTNAANAAAQRRYARHGFAVVGTRTYVVGGAEHSDVVMLTRFGPTPGGVAD
ncbi:tRNA (guanosine(37)-N1)-methyltransferase TrmD [Miniimonas sp. S16]|uniref:tRNA (guanosine(37)-N1)-methyltransferase TrmD n=1 Tax=Miniimonas sp. S16 TaxID=2171623 RepID=UPI000D528E56